MPAKNFCEDCGQPMKDKGGFLHRKGHVKCLCLQLATLQVIIDRLKNDTLADTIAKQCNAPGHSDKWCSICEARAAGIEAYQQAVLGKE